MKTLFIGSYGFGNLGDELCLLEAMEHFPSSEAWAFSHDPAFTGNLVKMNGFIMKRAPILAEIRPQRVVIGGGGVGFYPSIKDAIHWMRDGWEIGAECHIHNIGVGRITEFSWLNDGLVQDMLANLASCTVRDDMSWFLLHEWPVKLNPGITYYPERNLTPDNSLRHLLPTGRPVLGISITGQSKMRLALDRNPDRVVKCLEEFKGWRVVPIVSTVHDSDPEEDDIGGFNFFRERFLSDFEVVEQQFLDRAWWRANMTPLRLKGLIGGLDTLLSQRKHNCIHAIGTKTRMVGIFPGDDDSIMRIFFTLRNEIPAGSTFVSLPV